MSLIITILIFGFIILIHEWGHFIVARKSGVFVEEFAVGMGKKLWSVTKNGTMYSLRLFPLGGYCKMKDEDTSSTDFDSFSNATMPRKFAIIFAGAFMNFVLALVIFVGIAFFSSTTTTGVRDVVDNAPAQQSGIQKGDIITKIDGKKMKSFNDISFKIARMDADNTTPLNIEIKRGAEILNTEVLPKYDEKSGQNLIGIYPEIKLGMFQGILKNTQGLEGIPKLTFFETIKTGFWNMIFTIKATIIGFVELVTGQVNINQLMGPIGLAPVIDSQYDSAMKVGIGATVLTLLNIMALLSANIGVLNLLPLPALDGGRIVFLTLELIRKKPISPEKEGIVHIIGFILLMGLGIVIAFKDVINIIHS